MTQYVPKEWIEKCHKTWGDRKLSDILRMWADHEDELDALIKEFRSKKFATAEERNEFAERIGGLVDFIHDDLRCTVLVRIEEWVSVDNFPRWELRRTKKRRSKS